MSCSEKILEIISEYLELSADDIAMDSRLAEDLGIGSIDAVDIAMYIEDEFLVEMPDRLPQNIVTVGDVVQLVDNLIEKRGNLPKIIL